MLLMPLHFHQKSGLKRNKEFHFSRATPKMLSPWMEWASSYSAGPYEIVTPDFTSRFRPGKAGIETSGTEVGWGLGPVNSHTNVLESDCTPRPYCFIRSRGANE